MFVSSMLGSKLGIAVTWPLMGFIISAFGWKSAFYVTALFGFIVCYLWFNIVADSPEKHPNISKSERQFIEESLGLVIAKKEDFPPIMKMLKSSPFYALLFLHFSDVWGVFFLLTSAPMFMSQVLKFDIKKAGLISSFPYIARLVFGFAFGVFGDYLMSRGMGATKIRKLFCVFCEYLKLKFEEKFFFKV
jgi:MFS transporter, ACS family, solute carrier family 17 (sodium-dependent inorganic phosphate cotransporter), other